MHISTVEEAWEDFDCHCLNLLTSYPDYAPLTAAVLIACMTVVATAANNKFHKIYYHVQKTPIVQLYVLWCITNRHTPIIQNFHHKHN